MDLAQMIQILKLPQPRTKPSSIRPSNGSIMQYWNASPIATTHGWLKKFVLDSTILNAPSFESIQSFLSKFSQSKVYNKFCLPQIHQQLENQIHGSDLNLKTDIEKISFSIPDLDKLVAENSSCHPTNFARASKTLPIFKHLSISPEFRERE
ncbi:hypothetical protein Fot_55981 [Forsythia ovata]|uniref:Uncharacterized protein n=1 Tax=Forsythia ovata TaxID=205694 RepID=A0ABD1P223_9LAMI